MTDRKILSPDLLPQIAQALNIPMRGLVAVIELLDDGGTVPFIARYRKETTGNLDEVKVRGIEEKLGYFRDLVARRETILASIAEQGKLTDELRNRIEATIDCVRGLKREADPMPFRGRPMTQGKRQASAPCRTAVAWDQASAEGRESPTGLAQESVGAKTEG